MFKVDSPHCTPAAGIDRRGLRSAAGIGAVGALPPSVLALPAMSSPSAQLVEYRRCKAAWMACLIEPYKEDEAWEARVSETGDAVDAAIDPFLKLSKAPRSWNVVREIAEVWRTEMFDVGDDGELYKNGSNDEIDTMLLRAVLALPGGGPNV